MIYIRALILLSERYKGIFKIEHKGAKKHLNLQESINPPPRGNMAGTGGGESKGGGMIFLRA